MSPFKKYCFIVFGFILLPSNISGRILVVSDGGSTVDGSADLTSAEIEMDYFFGENALRTTQTTVCKGDDLKHECRMTCGSSNYGCIFNYCVCLDKKEKKGKKKEDENLPPSKHEIEKMLKDFEDVVDLVRRYLNDEQQSEEVELTEHPALRHHIAHFCPNLSVARQCIRTCMKVGKPAFCGKDHKCYCGHKYNEHDEDKKVDVDDMYGQFQDLYAKYFGKGSDKSMYEK